MARALSQLPVAGQVPSQAAQPGLPRPGQCRGRPGPGPAAGQSLELAGQRLEGNQRFLFGLKVVLISALCDSKVISRATLEM